MKTIFLHIGFPKTGTTLIQETLYANKEILLSNNYLYPSCLPANHSLPFIEFYRPENYTNKYDFTIDNTWNKNVFLDELKTNLSIDNLIISGEALMTFNKSQIVEFVESFKQIGIYPYFKIICFIREPVSFANSLTQQRTRTLKTKVIFKKKFIQGHIKPFIDTFGINNIKIIKYEDAIKSEQGIIGTFLNIIGLSKSTIQIPPNKRLNQSMSSEAYEIINYIIFVLPNFEKDNVEININKDDIYPIAIINGEKFELTTHEKIRVTKRFKSDIKWLKKNFNIDFEKKELHLEKNKIINYNIDYINELKVCLMKVPNKTRYLIYTFINNKLQTAKPDEKKYFITLLKHIKSEYQHVITSGYSIRNVEKILKKYNRIQYSKRPNQVL